MCSHHIVRTSTVTVGLINGQSDLRTSSGGVDYTNSTFYAPFGSSFTLLCEGGVGEKRWYVIGFGDIQTFLPTDSTQNVYQSSGQLIVGDFQQSEAEVIFCEDEGGSTVFTNLAEGTYCSFVSCCSCTKQTASSLMSLLLCFTNCHMATYKHEHCFHSFQVSSSHQLL